MLFASIGTYFPLRKGGRVRLYQDAHVHGGSLLPNLKMEGGVSYEHGNCWHDIFEAVNQARRLVYIVGWSVYYNVRLVRDGKNEAKTCTLGDLLKMKSQEGVRVLLLVWDDPTSRSMIGGYKTVKKFKLCFNLFMHYVDMNYVMPCHFCISLGGLSVVRFFPFGGKM